ncbi:TonB family C-terminal domain [Veillonella rodentium]|uniref:TonB family C-terminal domain n=2 Tax=Veillonella rodentium TaxID=248315 RepID=A0A239YDH2_9FIRM|nr:TonB family C-terminal domain [Veillonella rodentium]
MNKVLRCITLSALVAAGSVTAALAAPYEPPVAVSTPAVDSAVLDAYSGDIHGIDVQFTIKENGAVDDVKLLTSSGDAAVDASIVDAVSSWRFKPASDSDGKPVESFKTEFIDFKK